MSSSNTQPIAIIGAGLSGLTFALALHNLSIPSTIYELRSASYNIGGALMLSPNALRVLDSLGIYERIRAKGYHFETLTFTDGEGNVGDSYYFGNEKLYGYKAFRVYRDVLINEISEMVKERGIEVKYDSKFSHVVKEDEGSVEFALADGTTVSAPLLIAADGIHSRVRGYIHPNVKAIYVGAIGTTSALPVSKLRLPYPDFPLPASMATEAGAFVMAPQSPSGEEIFFGIQRVVPERSREGWDELRNSTSELVELMCKDKDVWPDVAQSAFENMDPKKISVWPFYMVPKMDRWMSKAGRVVLIGDAAHAIAPTAGQGVNQAFEDAHMLALLLSKQSEGVELQEALKYWQSFRSDRVTQILKLNDRMNAKRLPLAEQAKLPEGAVWKGGKDSAEDMRWLYAPVIEEEVDKWVAGRKQ